VTVGLIAMNDVLIDHAVDDRNSGAVMGQRLFLVALGDRIVDLANRAAHARAQRDIVCAVLIGLPCRFFR